VEEIQDGRSESMRIAIFSETFLPTPDGVAHFLGSFTRELMRLGHEPHVFTTGALNGGDGDEGGYVHRFKSLKFLLYPQYRIAPEPFTGALRTARRLGVEVIHAHTPFFVGTAGFICSRSLGVPIVGTFHTNFLDMSESISTSRVFRKSVRFAWWYTGGFYRRCCIVTTSSRSTAETLQRKTRRQVLIVPHGIDVLKFSPSAQGAYIREKYGIPRDAAIVTYLGRLMRDKGVHTLMDAFAVVSRKVEAYLVIAGVGPERGNLERRADILGIREDTRFTGHVDEAMKVDLLRQSGVVVLVSKADLVPLVLVEAMACGTPVIGSRAGGIPNLIEHGKTGILVNEGDPMELSEKILEVLYSTDLEGMTSNALKYVRENFSTRVAAKQFIEIYRRALRAYER
jgi:1,2-diacylglycerol 3-alpha-glucosyltransferase